MKLKNEAYLPINNGMSYSNVLFSWILFMVVICLFMPPKLVAQQRPIPLDNWVYIQVDSTRVKWGDWDMPGFLRYFGLDAMDVTGNGYKDLIAGRYFYRNPGGDMTAAWERIDIGWNIDGLMFLDIPGEKHAHVIAAAFPDVFLVTANDRTGSSWSARVIAQVPPTTHVNGQGFARARLLPGGNEDVLLATGGGIYWIEVPSSRSARKKDHWPLMLIAPDASDEGFGVGDIDGDGLPDIVAAVRGGDDEGQPMEVRWWKNPGTRSGQWVSYPVGWTVYDADRIAVADINSNGKADVVVTEERWPGEEPDASLYWFEQPDRLTESAWERHTIITTYSLNNLDVGDLNNNGFTDIVTSEHKGQALRTLIFENDGTGQFTMRLVARGREAHLGTRLFDLQGNGFLDILSIGWDHYQFLHLWRNNGDRWRHRRPFVPWTPEQ